MINYCHYHSTMGDKKHLQYAIMKYLDEEGKRMSEDQRESLEGQYHPYTKDYNGLKVWTAIGRGREGGLIIFPSNEEKIQWPTSRFENVADFCHFVT